MVLITGKSDLEGTEWAFDDVVALQSMLTDEEYEENITENMGDMKRLKVCSKILNDRGELPERYKGLVASYKKSQTEIPEILI